MAEPRQSAGQLLIVFDGQCGLCNGAVRWLLRRDLRRRLRFVPLHSEQAAHILSQLECAEVTHGRGPAQAPNTILAVRDPGGPGERLLVRSEAILAAVGELPQPWPCVAAALSWTPQLVRDSLYRLVARWRYRIWGRMETCPLSADEQRKTLL
jgi:predicted DCC family thiol-disulfide oxidoreductase YuxK